MTDLLNNLQSPAEDLTSTKYDRTFSTEEVESQKIRLMLSKKNKQCVKVKSQIRNCQAILEQQDEKLKTLQEQIANIKHGHKGKHFNWTSVKAAHLISKIFEKCEAVTETTSKATDFSCANANCNDKIVDTKYSDNFTSIETENSSKSSSTRCSYTIDFHRFAIALYFFSPTIYIFLSNLIPVFPQRNYIRQWVTAGRVEKLFPQGVYRDEFKE